jgi:aryl-alcohol dehydrogenase-like predicted oxidoreductase
VCEEYDIAVIPYSPLAGGFLTGKYSQEGQTESARSESVKSRYFNEAGWKTLDAVRTVADEAGSTPLAVSLAWLLEQASVTAPIIGANSPAQLAGNLAALDAASA